MIVSAMIVSAVVGAGVSMAAAIAQATSLAPQLALPTASSGADPTHHAISERRLPRLENALKDPNFEPLDPGSRIPLDPVTRQPAPEILTSIMDQLKEAKRILIVSHTVPPADGDTVGCALSLQRALLAMGKREAEVDVVADCDVPGFSRTIDRYNDLRAYDDVKDKDYDLAIVVDVGEAARIGRSADLIKKVPCVIDIDHHNDQPSRASLGLDASKPLTTWWDPNSPAAALLVASLVTHLDRVADHPFSPAQWTDIAEAALAGTLTDTGHFSYDGIELNALLQFKGLLLTHYAKGYDGLKALLKYSLPPVAVDLLKPEPKIGEGVSDAQRQKLAVTLGRMLGAHEQVKVEAAPGASLALVQLPDMARQLALQAAKMVEPKTNASDIREYVKGGLTPLKNDHAIAVLLTEDRGEVVCEIRSSAQGAAFAMARELGRNGGGHPNAAGTSFSCSLAEAAQKVRDWVAVWEKRSSQEQRQGDNRR